MAAENSIAPDFGLTASDYGEHRAGFPQELIDRLLEMRVVLPGARALDVGTGTGSLARRIAPHVHSVLATDPAEPLLEQARSHPESPPNVEYERGTAEETGLADKSMDLITAGQCWHWLQAERATRELLRVLKPGGRLVIAHFDWLPLPGNLVAATESLILRYSPDWRFGGGAGIYPRWLVDVGSAGFVGLETFSFDLPVSYSPEAWVGRVRASAGIGATLDPDEVERFSAELSELLEVRYPGDPLVVPHRVWALVAAKEDPTFGDDLASLRFK